MKNTSELLDLFLETSKDQRATSLLKMFVLILSEVKAEIEEKNITDKEKLLWLAQKEVWSRWKMFLQKIHSYNTPGSTPAQIKQEVLEEKMLSVIPLVYELWKEKEAQPKAASRHSAPGNVFFHAKGPKLPFYILDERNQEYRELLRKRKVQQ